MAMDQSIALRCVLQRRPRTSSPEPSTDDDTTASAQTAQTVFALIPNSVSVANLLGFVLHQLDVKDAAADCIAQVVLPGWRTLSLGEICTDPDSATVHSLLGNVSNIAVLLIQLPPAPPKSLSPAAVRRLVRSLLPQHTNDPHVQVTWLRQAGCPLGEPDLLSYLASPGDFHISEKARVDFADWRRRLRRLSSAVALTRRRRRASATTVEASDEADSMEAGRVTIANDDTDADADGDTTGIEEVVAASGVGVDGVDNDASDDEGYREHRRSVEAALARLSVLARAPRRPPLVQQHLDDGVGKENCCHGNAALPATPLPPPQPAAPLHRSRLFIDPHTEIPHLEKHFTAKPHPSGADCRQIAAELNAMTFRRTQRRLVQAKNVRLWFKNRRARARKVDPPPPPSPVRQPAEQPQPQLQMRLPILHLPAADTLSS